MIQNLALGVMHCGVASRADFRLAARVDDAAIDLLALAQAGALPLAKGEHAVLAQGDINAFLALGAARHREIYGALAHLYLRDAGQLFAHGVPLENAPMCLPVAPGDFVDFYASRHHAARCASLTGDANALPPAWDWMPLAYHSRTAGIIGNNAQIIRPSGWVQGRQGWAPRASRMLDVEMELGFILRHSTRPGEQLDPGDFEDAIFGAILVADWSARDLQGAEARPLGPFNAKAFATQMGDWIIPVELLASCAHPPGDLRPQGRSQVEGCLFNIDFTAQLHSEAGDMAQIGRANFLHMGWTPAEMMAHLTSGGAPVRSGDIFASGTISGPGADQTGCLLERQAENAGPLNLNGEGQYFFNDGDRLCICAEIFDGKSHIAFDKLGGIVINTPVSLEKIH